MHTYSITKSLLSTVAGLAWDRGLIRNYFLNTDRELFPSAPANHYYHAGAGANRIWVVPELDMVVVLRWVAPDHFDGFAKRLLAAIKPAT